MRKFIVFGIILIFIFSCKNVKISPEIIADIDNNILYYRVMYQSTASLENDEIIEYDKRRIKTEYFDRNENIIKELSPVYGVSYNIYEYDDYGNNISKNIYNENGELKYRNEYSFDESNRIIGIISYDKEGKYDGESKILYDYLGNLIQKITFDNNHEFNNSVIYAYDNNGRCYSAITTTYYDDFPLVTIYSYTVDGRLFNIQSFGNGHKQSMTKILEYDEEDREIKSINYVYDFDGKEKPSTINYYEYYTIEYENTSS